jgi:hypothetical protein
VFRIFKKSFYLALITLFIFSVIYIFMKNFITDKINWGVTYSTIYARELGLDWKQTYLDILDDLQIKNLRLIVYWPIVEPVQGQFNFTEVDWLIAEAQKREAKVILAIGERVPRWPECHTPAWAINMSPDAKEQRIKILYEETVKHFQIYSNITTWQVANEPFLKSFGKCNEVTANQINDYIKIIKSNDQKNRPVMLTESGELSTWVRSAKLADIIGSSLYRTVWNQYFGYWRYPWPPAYYRWHADMIMKFFPVKQVIISELQAEPWPPGKHILQTTLEDQFKSFDLKRLKSNIAYTKKTGFTEVYLWGVEWWYWLKIKHNQPEFWNMVKQNIK